MSEAEEQQQQQQRFLGVESTFRIISNNPDDEEPWTQLANGLGQEEEEVLNEIHAEQLLALILPRIDQEDDNSSKSFLISFSKMIAKDENFKKVVKRQNKNTLSEKLNLKRFLLQTNRLDFFTSGLMS